VRLAPAVLLLVAAALHVITAAVPDIYDLPVRWLAQPETEFAVRSRGIGRDRFVGDAEVVGWWRSDKPVWLITEESRLDLWRPRLGGDPGAIVARSGTRVLLGNRAAHAR